MTQSILLGFLGLVLLIFCIVDLWHLRQMLKVMRSMTYYMQEFVEFEQIRLKLKR